MEGCPSSLYRMLHQELLERCKRNDYKAQRALYDHLKARLFGLCRRYARHGDDAHDMLQETFVKIFTRIHQLESPEKLESWAKSIAVRTAIDHYNKAKKQEGPYSQGEYEVANFDYELVLENLSDEYLLSLINDLPEGTRIVFNLYEVEGYSHAEIAAFLEISEGTSRSQLHHAKYLLKQRLNALGVKRYEKYA
jgi:RNA polymerase sigma factor (sigma-70 family)